MSYSLLEQQAVMEAFSDIVHPSKTSSVYEGVPLENCNLRGKILEDIVRKMLEDSGETVVNPDQNTNHVGNKLGPHQTPYDFVANGKRVEVKSAQLRYVSPRECWYVTWSSVKWDHFDRLVLVLYSPSGLHIFEHDRKLGVSMDGNRQYSHGGKVNINGPRKEEDWKVSLNSILQKMSSLPLLKHFLFEDFNPDTTMTRTEVAFLNTPLSSYSAAQRGIILEKICLRVLVRNGETLTEPEAGFNHAGRKRSLNTAMCDIIANEKRTEVKSGQLRYDSYQKRWWFSWEAIKWDHFDRLVLVLYSPSGLHIFEHDRRLGVSMDGKRQYSRGGKVKIIGRTKEEDWKRSLDVILGKMSSLRLIEFIAF
jgi:hypothetical protein